MLRKDLLNVLLAVNKVLMLVATICEAYEDSVYKYHCVILASMSGFCECCNLDSNWTLGKGY